ncbi:MAG: hypothetical protein ACLRWP_09380 [Bilophila wadsworthia]
MARSDGLGMAPPQYPDEKRGVLELVTALENGLSLRLAPSRRRGPSEGIGRAAAVKRIGKRFSSGNRARPTS